MGIGADTIELTAQQWWFTGLTWVQLLEMFGQLFWALAKILQFHEKFGSWGNCTWASHTWMSLDILIQWLRKCLYVLKLSDMPWDNPLASGSDPTEVRFYRQSTREGWEWVKFPHAKVNCFIKPKTNPSPKTSHKCIQCTSGKMAVSRSPLQHQSMLLVESVSVPCVCMSCERRQACRTKGDQPGAEKATRS